MKLITKSLQVVVLFILVSVKANAQSIEIMTGHKNTQGDIQWLKPFSPKSKFLFHNRSRFTADYHNYTTYFISGITAFQIRNGFGIANEMLITIEGWLPKVGVQYLKSLPKLTAYAWLNSGYLHEWKYDFFSFIRWQPPINEKWKWYMQLELVNNFNGNGNEFSAQRPRIGLAVKSIQFGLAADFNEINNSWYFRSNAGAFVRKEF